ncbi:MAG: proteasome assembly chaperone family protein [Candidatus Methanomethylophilaceae archaeon]
MERMANTTIKYISKPVLRRPILIEGLPGIGNVGKITADFLASSLKAEKFASIYSEHFPPQVMLDDECVVHMACNDLYFAQNVGKNKVDVVFLLGEYQGTTANGQYVLCKDLMDEVFLRMDVSVIYTLGGYGTGLMADKPRTFGAVTKSSMKTFLEENGVFFSPGEPGAGILGASGLLLGMGDINDIDAACLMGETSGYFVDHKSAIALLTVLESILGLDLDKSDLELKSHQIDELTAKVKEYEVNQKKENLGYIG